MAKPTTTYSSDTKNATTFTAESKDSTTYNELGGADTGITLGDLSVTLDSLIYYLNGYTTQYAPSFSGKPVTTYTEE